MSKMQNNTPPRRKRHKKQPQRRKKNNQKIMNPKVNRGQLEQYNKNKARISIPLADFLCNLAESTIYLEW